MQRIFATILALIIGVAALAFLWMTNPLYAFVGGVVIVVVMLVGVGFLLNAPEYEPSPEEKAALQPRRTGEFRQVRVDELPEDHWQDQSRETIPPPQQSFGGYAPPAPSQSGSNQATPDEVVERLKEKMESGTLGESAEEVQELFDAALKKAKTSTVPQVIEEDEIIFEEADIAEKDDLITFEDIEPEAPADPEPVLPPAPATAAPPPSVEVGIPDPKSATDVDSETFDLMTLVGTLSPEKRQEFFALSADIPIGEQTETQLMELYQQIVNDDGAQDAISETQFSAYYPRSAIANVEYGFFVYAHLPDALIEDDVTQFDSVLGGRIPKAVAATNTAQIAEDTVLTALIECDALTFNQQGAVQIWKPPFVRFDFRFSASDKLVDELVQGRVSIRLGIIEIATISFQIGIEPQPVKASSHHDIPHDPRGHSKYVAHDPISPYQKIFISYAREDAIIAEQYRKVQTMAGNIIFMDVHSIRTGENWEEALKGFINDADVFQLFWSKYSANSEHVKLEWEYALTHRCPETRCTQFIRPAYWEKPLAPIPDDLNHLHFAYVELASN